MSKGKVLITGGSRGVGKACVEKFINEGYEVSFIYNNSKSNAEELEKATGAKAIQADVSNPSECVRAVAEAINEMGRVDILVNNAGVSLIKLFTETETEEYLNIMNTNIGGMFFVSREVVKDMLKYHSGRILNIGSMWGKVGASCEVAYSASKSAVRGFTMALAKELGPSGICVNCVELGVIDTDMNKNLDEAAKKELIDETPMGKIATPGEAADLIFTISTEKSGFLTGQIVGFDGGFAL